MARWCTLGAHKKYSQVLKVTPEPCMKMLCIKIAQVQCLCRNRENMKRLRHLCARCCLTLMQGCLLRSADVFSFLLLRFFRGLPIAISGCLVLSLFRFIPHNSHKHLHVNAVLGVIEALML